MKTMESISIERAVQLFDKSAYPVHIRGEWVIMGDYARGESFPPVEWTTSMYKALSEAWYAAASYLYSLNN